MLLCHFFKLIYLFSLLINQHLKQKHFSFLFNEFMHRLFLSHPIFYRTICSFYYINFILPLFHFSLCLFHHLLHHFQPSFLISFHTFLSNFLLLIFQTLHSLLFFLNFFHFKSFIVRGAIERICEFCRMSLLRVGTLDTRQSN